MSVPSFNDLGKNAREVFRMGYHYGKSLIKLNFRTKSGGNLEVGSNLSLDCDALKLTGSANAEYKTADYGSFLEKWSTDGTVVVGYNFAGIPIPDVCLKCEMSYNPETAAKGFNIGTTCAKDNVNALCSISTNLESNINILGSIVTTVKGLFIGYQGCYSTETNRMTKNDIGMAFSYGDVGVHLRCTQVPYEYGLSLLYKVSPDWDAGMDYILARTSSANEWALGAGARYKIDDKSVCRFKFNSDLQLGMSLQQKLDDSVSLTLSFNVDCANVTRGGHKVGLALEIEG